MQIFVRLSPHTLATSHRLNVKRTDTIATVKRLFEEREKVPSCMQLLTEHGEYVLADHLTLADCGIGHEATLQFRHALWRHADEKKPVRRTGTDVRAKVIYMGGCTALEQAAESFSSLVNAEKKEDLLETFEQLRGDFEAQLKQRRRLLDAGGAMHSCSANNEEAQALALDKCHLRRCSRPLEQRVLWTRPPAYTDVSAH